MFQDPNDPGNGLVVRAVALFEEDAREDCIDVGFDLDGKQVRAVFPIEQACLAVDVLVRRLCEHGHPFGIALQQTIDAGPPDRWH